MNPDRDPWWAGDHLDDDTDTGWSSYAECVTPDRSELAEQAAERRSSR